MSLTYEQLEQRKHKRTSVTLTYGQLCTLQDSLAWDFVRAKMELQEEPHSINDEYPKLLLRIAAQIEKQTGVEDHCKSEAEGFKRI